MQTLLIPKLPATQLHDSTGYEIKLLQVVWFHKIFITTPRGVIENSKGEGILMKPNFQRKVQTKNGIIFQRDGRFKLKHPLQEGMDIVWNRKFVIL